MYVRNAHADEFFGAVAEHAPERRIGTGEPSGFRVRQCNAVARAFKNGAKSRFAFAQHDLGAFSLATVGSQYGDQCHQNKNEDYRADDGVGMFLPLRKRPVDEHCVGRQPAGITAPAPDLLPVEHRDAFIHRQRAGRRRLRALEDFHRQLRGARAGCLDGDHRAADAAVFQVVVVEAEYRGVGGLDDHVLGLVGQRHAALGVAVVLGEDDDAVRRQVGHPCQDIVQRHAFGVFELQLAAPGLGDAGGLVGDADVGCTAARGEQHPLRLRKQFQRPFQSALDVEPVDLADDAPVGHFRLGQRLVLDGDHRRPRRNVATVGEQKFERRLLRRDNQVDGALRIFLAQHPQQVRAVVRHVLVALQVEVLGMHIADREVGLAERLEQSLVEQLHPASAVAVGVEQQNPLRRGRLRQRRARMQTAHQRHQQQAQPATRRQVNALDACRHFWRGRVDAAHAPVSG